RQVPATGGPGTLSFLLADQLGTTTMVLDATGAVVADQRYWPYGATRAGAVAQTDKLYTGQRQEPGDPAALGLYDYHARFYSTLVGRFVSADSRGSNGTDLYGYVTDNPLRYTDPTGEHWTDEGDNSGYTGSHPDQAPYVAPVCDLACAEIAAWVAFHPGECWGCSPTPSVARTPVPSLTPIPVELPCGEASPCELGGPSVAVLPAVAFGAVANYVGGRINYIKRHPELALVVLSGGEDPVEEPAPEAPPAEPRDLPSGWPAPPGYDTNTWRQAPASRPSVPGDHLWDPQGGEGRWHAPDKYHDTGHCDYNPHVARNSQWQQIYP
ncbi:MAG: RHS repeat-associated core domain-containing protein, partial [Chloroflexota bacterium]|nr:RHS repeat-associated core domain-containing protein [Chloroflexota bacterium]